MYFKSSLKILFITYSFTFCNEDLIKPASQCQKTFVQNFGLDALVASQESDMLMCKQVKQTCCKTTAQQQMYQNWVLSGDQEYLTNRFIFQYRTYNETLKIFEKSHDWAKKLFKKMQHTPTNNCKVLAQKVLEFDIPTVVENMENILLDFYDFWYDTYEGLYCSICSTYDQFQIDFEKEKIYLSNGFCRKIVAKNITFLVYFKYYMVDIMNLIHEFLANCNYQGVYNESDILDKAFMKKDKYYLDLQQCYEEFTRDKAEKDSSEEEQEDRWFEYCSFICNKFKINSFDEFFSPRLSVFIEYDILMNEYLQKIEKDNRDFQKMLKKTQYRVLEETGFHEDKIEDQSLRRKLLLPYIYYQSSKKANFKRLELRDKIHTSQQNMTAHLENYKLIFREDETLDGIDFYFRGENTLILKQIYDFNLSKEMEANTPRNPNYIEVISYKGQTVILKNSYRLCLGFLVWFLLY